MMVLVCGGEKKEKAIQREDDERVIHFSSFRRVKDAQWFVRGKEENKRRRGGGLTEARVK